MHLQFYYLNSNTYWFLFACDTWSMKFLICVDFNIFGARFLISQPNMFYFWFGSWFLEFKKNYYYFVLNVGLRLIDFYCFCLSIVTFDNWFLAVLKLFEFSTFVMLLIELINKQLWFVIFGNRFLNLLTTIHFIIFCIWFLKFQKLLVFKIQFSIPIIH